MLQFHTLLLLINLVVLVVASSLNVSFGNAVIPNDRFRRVIQTLSCWSNHDGNWTDPPLGSERMYTKVYSNNDNLVTKVYTSCNGSDVYTDYLWKPDYTSKECVHAYHEPFHPFSINEMCRIMKGRSIVFIGDSLSLHYYETMLNVLGNRTVYGHLYDNHPYDHWEQQYDCCINSTLSGKAFRVNYLAWNNIKLDYGHRENIKQIHERDNGSIIIANWGAFYNNNETVYEHMHQFIGWIDATIPTSLFIFRSSNMGHHRCQSHSIPSKITYDPVDFEGKAHWHHRDFPYQNSIWSDYITNYNNRNTTKNKKIYLDVSYMLSKRPDMHSHCSGNNDCLHYQIPGPIDMMVRIIFATLYLIDAVSIGYSNSLS